jgi:hypothetical protein
MAIDLSKYKKATTTQATSSPKVDLSKYKKPQGRTGLSGFATGVAQSIVNPLQNVGRAVLKPLEAGYEAITGREAIQTGIPEQVLTPKSSSEKLGYGAGTIAQYIAPVGAINRSTQALSTIPRIVARTAPDVALSLAQTGGDLKAGAGTAGASAIANALIPGPSIPMGTLRQVGSGYAGDVSMGLAGQRGAEREGASAFIPGLGTAIGASIPITGKALNLASDVRAGNFKSKGDVNKLIGEITQVPDEIQKTKLVKAFSNLDVKDVKNYKDLSTKANNKIKLLSESLDDVLDTNTNLFKGDSLTLTKDIDGTPVKANFVDSALNQLENLYAKIEDPFNAQKIKQLRQKANTEGLTIKEINSLARNYGNEFNQKAFSRIGEPLTSVTAQGVENTRSGLKETARNLFGDDVFSKVDDELSSLINLRETSDKMQKKVETLKNRIKERSLGEKVGRLIFRATDLLSLGTFGGFTRAILPRGQGLKVMNALDLEATLNKNLQQLDNILKIQDKNKLESELRKIINQSQALPDNQRNTISAASTAKNVDIPPQSNIPAKKSSGLINTIKKKIDETPNKQGGFIKLPQGKGEVNLPKKTEFNDITKGMWNSIKEVGENKIARVNWDTKPWKLVDTTDFQTVANDNYKAIAEFQTRDELYDFIKKQQSTQSLPKSKVNESVSLPKNNTDLITEAKKYKSAEEFVNKVDITGTEEFKKWAGKDNVVEAYHGSPNEFNSFKVGDDIYNISGQPTSGISFADDFKGAEPFSRQYSERYNTEYKQISDKFKKLYDEAKTIGSDEDFSTILKKIGANSDKISSEDASVLLRYRGKRELEQILTKDELNKLEELAFGNKEKLNTLSKQKEQEISKLDKKYANEGKVYKTYLKGNIVEVNGEDIGFGASRNELVDNLAPNEILKINNADTGQYIGTEYMTNNPENIFIVNAGKTKSQLEQIWKEANTTKLPKNIKETFIGKVEEGYKPAIKSTPKGFNDFVKEKYGSDVDVFTWQKDGNIELAKIIVPKANRNKGVGTSVMKDLIEHADKTGQTITLTPGSEFGGSVSRLKDFYKRFDFEKNKDLGIKGTLIRFPKK